MTAFDAERFVGHWADRLRNVADLGRLCVYLSTRDCYATNAIFHVDGGIDSNNSPLPIPDY